MTTPTPTAFDKYNLASVIMDDFYQRFPDSDIEIWFDDDHNRIEIEVFAPHNNDDSSTIYEYHPSPSDRFMLFMNPEPPHDQIAVFPPHSIANAPHIDPKDILS